MDSRNNASAGGDSPAAAQDRDGGAWHWTRLEKGGCLSIPAAFCEALGIGEDDPVQLRLVEGGVEVRTRDQAIRDLQEDVRRAVPADVSLVDELIAERRAEAAREASDD